MCITVEMLQRQWPSFSDNIIWVEGEISKLLVSDRIVPSIEGNNKLLYIAENALVGDDKIYVFSDIPGYRHRVITIPELVALFTKKRPSTISWNSPIEFVNLELGDAYFGGYSKDNTHVIIIRYIDGKKQPRAFNAYTGYLFNNNNCLDLLGHNVINSR